MFLKVIFNKYFCQSGFSLIEVLVSVCIISIAFSGIIKIQSKTLESSSQIQQLVARNTEEINKTELAWISVDQNF
ncbi:prepilin-type N-terminal cleavage/methylation domain-containing protein [Thiotrichales bacterium 19S3-7]|nr:prepilin-type N-terminal cleavage/methylation domain-containing protein [Thiotrichales bacterium 19S3-7]MCF6801180.1 prepilin-type N-terminal cleavage/methylation domain-containing protein [Thiotrichales bacterium 19S3-11]